MQMPIPDDWDGESFCEFSVCWPNTPQWKNILRGLATNPSKGRFWDAETGGIIATQTAFEPAYKHNLDLPEVIMSCANSEIADALNNIALALSSPGPTGTGIGRTFSSCCQDELVAGGGGVIGSTVQPVSEEEIPLQGSEQPLEVAPDDFPDGYTSLEEYQADKCNLSNGIVDGVIATLRAFGAFGVFNFIALAGLVVASIAGAIIFPPALIPTACVMLALLLSGITLLTAAAEGIEANRDAWVCALYEGDNVASIVGVIADLVDALIASIGATSVQGVAVKTILLVLFNTDTINQLMRKTSHIVYEAVTDCTACGATCLDCLFRLNQAGAFVNNLVVESSGFFTFISLHEDSYTVYVRASGPDTYRLRFQELTGWTFIASPSFVVRQNSGDVFYAGDVFADFQAACETACITAEDTIQWAIASSTSFTVQAKSEFCV